MSTTQSAWLVMHQIVALTKKWDAFPGQVRRAAKSQFSARAVEDVMVWGQ